MTTNVWLSGDWGLERETRDAFAVADGVELASTADAADVIVHVVRGGSPCDELAALREHARAPIVLLVAAGTAGLLEAAVDADAIDVLVRPQPHQAVVFAARRAAAAAARRRAEQPLGRVVTVFSPKGGAGKSVVSSNLATLLAARGHRTLLVDLDLQFGDAAIMLGLDPEQTLHDLLIPAGPVDIAGIAGRVIRHRTGLDVLAAPLDPEEADAISDERIAELLGAARSGYDVVVVDTMPFFHGAVLAAVDCTDELLVVCTPDVPTLKNVCVALRTLELLEVPSEHVRVVLNRASARVGYRAAQVATVLDREVAFELPEDEAVAIAVNRGVPVAECSSQAPFARAIAELADHVAPVSRATRPSRLRRLVLGRRA